MSRKPILTIDSNGLAAPYISANYKVAQYLQQTSGCSRTNTNNNPLYVQHGTFTSKDNLYGEKYTSMNNNYNQLYSTAFDINGLPRSDFNCSSVLSNTGDQQSMHSSNTSSGIYSGFSDVTHEENLSSPSEDLDFNLAFDQSSNDDEIEVDDFDEIGSHECIEEKEPKSTKNSDTATLLDNDELNLDARINELQEFSQKSFSSTCLNSNSELNNDDSTVSHNPKQHNLSLLHNSSSTLCSQDLFTAYAEDDSDDDKNGGIQNTIIKRSNSVGIVLTNRKQVLVDKPPKKVVRFADMMGLDLESIRYMTPPDYSVNATICDSVRMKLDQLLPNNNSPNSPGSYLSSFNLPGVFNRSFSSSSLTAPKKRTNQFYLVSKCFKSPSNIVSLVRSRQIILECLYTNDSTAYGTIRVNNCAFQKRVFARLTTDDWKSFEDISACHSMYYEKDNADAFTFEIHLKNYNNLEQVSKRVYFAICLQVENREYWDNNFGWNYILDILEKR